MARSVSAILVLGFLAVAAFSMGEAAAAKAGPLSAVVKVSLFDKCSEDLRLVVSVGNVLDCKKGSLAVLGPVAVKLEALNLLKVQLFVFDKNGKLLKVKAVVKIDLGVLGTLVNGIVDVALDAVEELVEGAESKLIKLFCGNVLLASLVIDL